MKTLTLLLFLLVPNLSGAEDDEVVNDAGVVGVSEQDLQSQVFAKVLFLKHDLPIQQARVVSKYIARYSLMYELPVNVVIAIAHLESRFNQAMRGRAGERGMMQVMPFWRVDSLCVELAVLTIPGNIECSCRILKLYVDMYDGDVVYGIATYNQGPYNTLYMRQVKYDVRRLWYVKTILATKKRLDWFDGLSDLGYFYLE